MLLFAEEVAKRKGLTEIRLYTNELFTENIALYSKYGYRELYREAMGAGRAVHMAKQVPGSNRDI